MYVVSLHTDLLCREHCFFTLLCYYLLQSIFATLVVVTLLIFDLTFSFHIHKSHKKLIISDHSHYEKNPTSFYNYFTGNRIPRPECVNSLSFSPSCSHSGEPGGSAAPGREKGPDDSSSDRVHRQLWNQLEVLGTVKDNQRVGHFHCWLSAAHFILKSNVFLSVLLPPT